MPKVTDEFLLARREEIIDACARLYETMSFKEITLKEIGKALSFNRTSIYNYFDTKEDIFLALLQREYELWVMELESLRNSKESLSRLELADALARSLDNREQLLKLLSMNHFDLEKNSRYENLVEFKRAYGSSIMAVKQCLDKFCPDMAEEEKQEFLYVFFPFVMGIYPYTAVSEKQKNAMNEAGLNFVYYSAYEIAFNCLKKLLVTNSQERCI